MTAMRILPRILFPAILLVSACSETSRTPDILKNINVGSIQAPDLNIPPVKEWRAPDTGDFGTKVAANFQELKNGIARQVEITKMPKYQRVMVVKGPRLAKTKTERDAGRARWNPNQINEWTVMLEDARLFVVRQPGPQFYQYESLILSKKGLKLTLSRGTQSDAPLVAPPEPYQQAPSPAS